MARSQFESRNSPGFTLLSGVSYRNRKVPKLSRVPRCLFFPRQALEIRSEERLRTVRVISFPPLLVMSPEFEHHLHSNERNDRPLESQSVLFTQLLSQNTGDLLSESNLLV